MTECALTWLRRSCGKWRSERRYLFQPDGKPVNLTTMMDIYEGERGNQFIVEWTGKTTGKMELELDGNVLVRNRNYFGDEAHDSDVEMLTSNMIRLTTSYGGVTYVETIELLSSDQYRLRNAFGHKSDGSFVLTGSYFEFRL